MNTPIVAINDLRELPDHLNIATIVSMLRAINIRMDKFAEQLNRIEGKNEKPRKKELTRVGRFEDYINECMKDGKIWSTYSLEEEIRACHPELPSFTHAGVQGAALRMWHQDKLEKVSAGTYRRKT